MLVRLDPRSDKPIYLQVADSIAGQIDDGGLGPGQRLPSARALGETLGVNMHTVLKAYSELERRAMVEMRRGRAGVVVSEGTDLARLAAGLVSAARRQGLAEGEVLEIVRGAWR